MAFNETEKLIVLKGLDKAREQIETLTLVSENLQSSVRNLLTACEMIPELMRSVEDLERRVKAMEEKALARE